MYDLLSKLAKRMAILGTIPLTTAPRPLYRPRGVSRAAICLPVAKKPNGLSCNKDDSVKIDRSERNGRKTYSLRFSGF